MTLSSARFGAPALLAVLAIAGCGSSNSSSSSTAASTPAASSTAASSSTTASSTTAAAAPASAAKSVDLTTKKAKKLGTILAAGPKKLTVYLWEADKGTHSACSGDCAKVWPPVLGSAKVAGGAMAANLGTTKRSDGTTQVTYKGHPLYYFLKDRDDEDAYGQGSHSFGAGWYVLKPSGAKIDES